MCWWCCLSAMRRCGRRVARRGIMAAVMASDSQILALSTMFTEDVFAYYGGKERFGEVAQVHTGRAFVIVITVFATSSPCARRRPSSISRCSTPSPATHRSRCWWRRRCSGRKAISGRAGGNAVDRRGGGGVALLQVIVPAPPERRLRCCVWLATTSSRAPPRHCRVRLPAGRAMVLGSVLLMVVVSKATRQLPRQ